MRGMLARVLFWVLGHDATLMTAALSEYIHSLHKRRALGVLFNPYTQMEMDDAYRLMRALPQID